MTMKLRGNARRRERRGDGRKSNEGDKKTGRTKDDEMRESTEDARRLDHLPSPQERW